MCAAWGCRAGCNQHGLAGDAGVAGLGGGCSRPAGAVGYPILAALADSRVAAVPWGSDPVAGAGICMGYGAQLYVMIEVD